MNFIQGHLFSADGADVDKVECVELGVAGEMSYETSWRLDMARFKGADWTP